MRVRSQAAAQPFGRVLAHRAALQFCVELCCAQLLPAEPGRSLPTACASTVWAQAPHTLTAPGLLQPPSDQQAPECGSVHDRLACRQEGMLTAIGLAESCDIRWAGGATWLRSTLLRPPMPDVSDSAASSEGSGKGRRVEAACLLGMSEDAVPCVPCIVGTSICAAGRPAEPGHATLRLRCMQQGMELAACGLSCTSLV